MDSKNQTQRREIKFRAWDKSHKMMFYPKDITHITFGHSDWDMIYTKTGTPGSWGKKYPDEMEIMQFTGLKDKTGKEIYEGDIIKTETEKAMQVSWNVHFASFCLDRDGWMFTHYFGEAVDPEQVEVIGNIYENHELLNYPRDERENTRGTPQRI